MLGGARSGRWLKGNVSGKDSRNVRKGFSTLLIFAAGSNHIENKPVMLTTTTATIAQMPRNILGCFKASLFAYLWCVCDWYKLVSHGLESAHNIHEQFGYKRTGKLFGTYLY